MVDIITKNHCRKILLGQNTTYMLKSFRVESLEQETLGGLIGLCYILTIDYKSNDTEYKTLQLFVKTLNAHNKIMFEVSQDLLFYEKEELFFMELLPKFEKVGVNVLFAPRGYLCADNAVFLEDLTLSGFKLFPKDQSLDMKHCRACLATIAEFHASSLTFEICKSNSSGMKYTLLGEYSNILKDLIFSGGDTYGTKYVQKSVEGLIALAELEFDDETTLEELKQVFVSGGSVDYNGLCCVLLHGDLWTNNFLHKYEGDEIVESRLIDFQTIKYGPPGLDVLQFIYTNTRKSLRNQHFNELISYYYQKMSDILDDRAIEIADYLPKEELLRTCDMLQVPVKLQAVIDRCLTAIPDGFQKDTFSDGEKFNDFIFVNRSKYLIEFYNNIPTYKELVSEDLRELRDMLYKLK